MADDNTGSWMDFAQRSRDDGGLGLERHQAAGVVGNLQNESGSGITPWGVSGDNGTAQGSAQWRGDRLNALRDHAESNGLDYRTPEAQQSFMRHEFDTTENASYKAIQAAQTPEDAATAMNTRYERSADRSGNRERSARSLYDGSDGPTAIDTAMGRTRSPAGSRMAFAPTDDEDTPAAPPALSAAATLGPGQLGANPAGAPAPKNWLDLLGTTLMNMAPGIAQDPENKKALVAAANEANKGSDAGTWTAHTLPNGKVGFTNSKRPGMIDANGNQMTGSFASEDRKWVTVGHDAYGKPIMGPQPTAEEYAATQSPTAKAATAAAEAAANPQAGLTGQPFMDALASKDKLYAGRVQAVIDGRDNLPQGRAAMEGTPGGQMVKDVMAGDPTFEQGNSLARVKLRQAFETASAPNSPAVQIKNGNTTLSHGATLSDAIEKFKAFNDHSGTPYISYGLNAAHNSQLAGTSSEEAQAYTSAIDAREHYGDEISKYYGGGPAGEHAKQRALANIDFNKSLPELRSAMATDAEMVHGKSQTYQDQWKQGMRGSSQVADFPVVSAEGQAARDRIVERYERSKDGIYTGPTAKPVPAGQSRVGVPKQDRPPLTDIFK
jgi:Phage tail lysozyme